MTPSMSLSDSVTPPWPSGACPRAVIARAIVWRWSGRRTQGGQKEDRALLSGRDFKAGHWPHARLWEARAMARRPVWALRPRDPTVAEKVVLHQRGSTVPHAPGHC